MISPDRLADLIFFLVACFKQQHMLSPEGAQWLFEQNGATSIASALAISATGALGASFAAIVAATVTSKHARSDATAQMVHAERRFASEQDQAKRLARQPLINESITTLIQTVNRLRKSNFSSQQAAYFNEDWIYSSNLVALNFFEAASVARLEEVERRFSGIITLHWNQEVRMWRLLTEIENFRDSNPSTKNTPFIILGTEVISWPRSEAHSHAAAMDFFGAAESIRRTFTDIARGWPDEELARTKLSSLSQTLDRIVLSYEERAGEITSMHASITKA